MLEAWIDGACEPINPGGTASYGLIVKKNGQIIFQRGGVIGSGKDFSSNVAEYGSLLAFLDWYVTTGKLSTLAIYNYESALIISDSLMLVNQMANLWSVHQGLYVPYYLKAIDKIRQHGLGHCLSYKWIPREQNQEADNLSKCALLRIGIKPRH